MDNDQTEQKHPAPTHEELRKGNAAKGTSPTQARPRSFAGLLSVLLVIVGSALQGYANRTVDATFVAFLLLLAGVSIVSLVFPKAKAEQRAFLLTYGICVFAGGLVQYYSLAVFHNPQSTIDALYDFFPNISARPPFRTMASAYILGEDTLPIVIWQQLYKLTWFLGLEHGPYIGVMLNALVMGMTGSLTVRAARELFGDDAWRLRRVGTLFAFCGLFILFGSVLIRDCFTTFLNALVLWGIIRWLVRSTLRNLLFAIMLTCVSAYAMVFLRPDAVVLFGLFWLLALLSWYSKQRLNVPRLYAITFAIGILLLSSGYILDYGRSLQETQTRQIAKYNEWSADADTGNSLGVRLVVSQPLPIRLVAGAGMLMVSPIPLWVYFKSGSNDYHLLMGYNGIYQVLVMPLVFAGFLAAYRLFRRDRKQAAALAFLAVYILMNLAAVVTTSLEQRHLAQFMPAIMILAALPDTRNRKVRTNVQSIAGLWFAAVVLLHVTWAVMKGY